MRKVKQILIVSVFMLVAVSSTFAAGGFRLGLEGGNPDVVGILRLNPLEFKLGYHFDTAGNGAFIHLSGDYRIVEVNLIEFLNLYVGAGVYFQILTAGDNNFSFGGRVPVGVNAYLVKGTLEFFVEIVPVVTFYPGLALAPANFQGFAGFTVAIPKF